MSANGKINENDERKKEAVRIIANMLTAAKFLRENYPETYQELVQEDQGLRDE